MLTRVAVLALPEIAVFELGVLTEIFGYSSEQAAQILGIRPTTVRVLASQGRAALRRR